MIQMFTKKRKGFTLIELIVVVAILGILAAIAIPRLTGQRLEASRKSVVANLRTIDSAITVAEANGTAITAIGDLVTGDLLAAVPVTTGVTYAITDVDSGAGVEWRATAGITDFTVFGTSAPAVNVSAGVFTVEHLKTVAGW